MPVGPALGASDGSTDGGRDVDAVGGPDCAAVSTTLGTALGEPDGAVGTDDGDTLGSADGAAIGFCVGCK